LKPEIDNCAANLVIIIKLCYYEYIEPRYPSPSRAPSYKKILETEAERRGLTVNELKHGIKKELPPKRLNIKMRSWRKGWYRQANKENKYETGLSY